MGPRRPRELLIGASLVSIEGFLVELQPVPVTMPIITPGPVVLAQQAAELCAVQGVTGHG